MVGGAEEYIRKISNKLTEKGHEIIIITVEPFKGISSMTSECFIENGIKIYRFFPLNIYSDVHHSKAPSFLKPFWHMLSIYNLHSYFVIKKILKKEKPDVVHTNNLGGISTSAFKAAKSLNIPIVHTCHDFYLVCPFAILLCSFNNWSACTNPLIPCKIYRKLKKELIGSKPAVVTAPSNFVLNKHVEKGFFKDSKKLVLPLGIELCKDEFYGSLPPKKESVDILYVGKLERHKGVQILINAFKKVDNTNVCLHIIGSGNYSSDIKKLASEDQRIHFYGQLPNEEVQEFYKKVDITVVPSICYENSPVVIYESLKKGIPVIGSNIGGIPELIKNNSNGFLFEAGDTEHLALIIKDVATNSSKRIILRNNAAESVKEYGMENHINNLITIYTNLIPVTHN